jgi:hypothetical protein
MAIEDWHTITILAPSELTTGHHAQIVWCEERLGKRWSVVDNREGTWCCFWSGKMNPSTYRFQFKNEQDAILFSLIWL